MFERDPADGPGTHAIVIGVGAYPNLVGGDGIVVPALAEGMGQLTSPPLSAVALADWLAASHNDPAAPLASVDLLVSAGDGPFVHVAADGTETKVATPTHDEIVAALRAWKERGQAHGDGVLMFFFCGHGVTRAFDTALLARDYAADAEQPFAGAIWFEGMKQGMRSCAAKRQLYFVDACRVGSENLLRDFTAPLDPVFSARGPYTAGQAQATYYATTSGQPAYGIPGRPSVFTANLLMGLGGMGANDDRGDWRVDTTKLQRALGELAGDFASPEQFGLPPPVGGDQSLFEFHTLPGPPAVPFCMELAGADDEESPPAPVERVAVTCEGEQVFEWPRPWASAEGCRWEYGRFRSDQVAGMRYSWSVTMADGTSLASAPRTLNPPLRIVEFPRDAVA